MTIDLSTLPANHRAAIVAVNTLNLEGLVSANVINVFRNVFPSVSQYLEDTILQFTAKDDAEFDFDKKTRAFSSYKHNAQALNFVAMDELLVAVPQGLNSKYIPYLKFLKETGEELLKERDKLLEDYRRALSAFISSADAKTALRDYSSVYQSIEMKLAEHRTQLASYFNEKSTVTALPLYAVFEQGVDIVDTVELAKDVNKIRTQTDRKDVMGNVKDISSLLNLVIQRSEEQAIENVSAQAANSIAQGAMAVAHYVEFLGIFRYRLEEAIGAVGQMAERLTGLKNVAG